MNVRRWIPVWLSLEFVAVALASAGGGPQASSLGGRVARSRCHQPRLGRSLRWTRASSRRSACAHGLERLHLHDGREPKQRRSGRPHGGQV